MRPEDDFEAYTAARWPQVLRALALLGCPDVLAADVAADGLARCRPGWAATVRDGDLDTAVLRSVLAAWDERRRTAWWEALPPPASDPARDAADEALGVLTGRQRAAVVLCELGGLGPAQIAAALDDGEDAVRAALDTAGIDPGLLARAAAAVPLVAPPYDGVAQRAARRTRARRSRLAVLALAAAAVVAGGVAALTGTIGDDAPASERLAPAPVRYADNPLPVAWYAEGELHLPEVVLRVPGLLDLVEVVGGAVYLDPDGRVVGVDQSGSRTVLGQGEPGTRLVASQDGDHVGWRERSSGDLVAHDVEAGRDVRRVSGIALRPVSLDGERLVYNAAAGAYAVLLPDGRPRRLDRRPLLDARGGSRLAQVGARRVGLRAPPLRTEQTAPGRGGSLSDDGRFALTEVRGRPVVLDALGGRQETGVRPGESVAASRLFQEGAIVLVVAPVRPPAPDGEHFGRLSESGSWELRTCLLGSGVCALRGRLSTAGAVPMLAR